MTVSGWRSLAFAAAVAALVVGSVVMMGGRSFAAGVYVDTTLSPASGTSSTQLIAITSACPSGYRAEAQFFRDEGYEYAASVTPNSTTGVATYSATVAAWLSGSTLSSGPGWHVVAAMCRSAGGSYTYVGETAGFYLRPDGSWFVGTSSPASSSTVTATATTTATATVTATAEVPVIREAVLESVIPLDSAGDLRVSGVDSTFSNALGVALAVFLVVGGILVVSLMRRGGSHG